MRFRKALGAQALDKTLFDEGTRQLKAKAIQVKTGAFTVADLAGLAAKDEISAEQGASLYLQALAKTGYLRRLPKRNLRDAGPPGRGQPIRYLLIKNTGPLAPVVSRAQGLLRDPNNGESVSCRF